MLSSWCFPRGRRLLALAGILVALMGLGLLVGRSVAQTEDPPVDPHDPSNLVRVEEDWVLWVTEPDVNKAAPQVATQMIRSPDSLRFCTFHLNSCDIPTFNQGGLQVQAWEGNTNLAVQTSANRTTMVTPNEIVTWTQYLQREGTTLKFGISAASCAPSPGTWGDFSGVEILVPDSGADLSNYSIDYSLDNSGITFGANRVAQLMLLRVRKYYFGVDEPDEETVLRSVYSPDATNSGVDN